MHRVSYLRSIMAGTALTGLLGCGVSFAPGVPLTGRWGGKDLVADLTSTGGALDLTCGSGKLDAPLVPDGAGWVSASGFTVTEGGAPPPPNYVPPRSTVVVSGRVDGNRLTLVVTTLGIHYTADGPPRYALVRGQEGNVIRCP